jgi:hypothetical protein
MDVFHVAKTLGHSAQGCESVSYPGKWNPNSRVSPERLPLRRQQAQTGKGLSACHLVAWFLSILLAATTGCTVVHETAKLPIKTVNAVVPGSKNKQPDPAAVQTLVLGYADDFFGLTSSGLDEYARRVNTTKAQAQALSWKLALNSSALGIATGANPTANLVDFLALSGLTRNVVEKKAREAQPPGAMDLWLQNARDLETNAWSVAAQVFTADQQEEIRAALGRWLVQDTNSAGGFFRRPQELTVGLRQQGEKESHPGSVFSLVGLDPTSGLDPAVREVTRTRLFAERAMFTAQRMPILIRWQTEVMLDQLLHQEQLTNALTTADRLSRAAESASQTAALLPERLSAERKAVLDALDAQEGKLKDLSSELGRTLTAGEKMSTSLNTTLTTFDALMKRFGVGEPSTSPPDTNSRPFNVLEYAQTAEQIAAMAQQLNALLKDASGTLDTPALDKRLASLKALAAQTGADAKSVLNHAFLLLASLILLTFSCALVYRWLGPRLSAPRHRPAHETSGTVLHP